MSELLGFLTTNGEQFRRNRLAALYSDFGHLRAINPDGYTANIEAWRKGLADAAREGHIPSKGTGSDLLLLKVDEELLRALETREWGRPLALGSVMGEAISKKEMMPLQEFLATERSIYHKSWTPSPRSLVSWGLRLIGLAGGQYGVNTLPNERLVILANVEAASKNIVQQIEGQTARTERIYSKHLFVKAFANALRAKHLMSQTDIDVLLKFMARDQHLLAYDGRTIKFMVSTEAGPSKITPEDSTIASLKELMQDLDVQVDTLSRKVEILSSAAREAVSRGRRVSALTALRSKKLIETHLSKQAATLSQLEEVYLRISQAEDQVQLIRIMEGSTGVLKALNAEVGGVERVDNIVDQLKEQITQVEEIGNVITEAGQSGSVDEDEVEGELEGMEQAERNKREETERLEREKKVQQEAADTKRKLNNLASIEEQALQHRQRESQEQSVELRPLEKTIDQTATSLREMSLNRQTSPETVT